MCELTVYLLLLHSMKASDSVPRWPHNGTSGSVRIVRSCFLDVTSILSLLSLLFSVYQCYQEQDLVA